MELTIKDRLFIPALLPKEGTFKEYNLKKQILSRIEITRQERDDIHLRENEDTKRIEWDEGKEAPLIAIFTREEADFLKRSCERLSEESLPDDMWATVEKVYDMADCDV